MTVVAEEAGVLVTIPNVVLQVVQGVIRVLPVRDQAGDVFVHGHERIFVDRSTGEGQVPSAGLVGVAEVPKIKGLG